jgi:Flp pilus assembly protein TadB
MATGDASEASSAGIDALTAQLDGMRATVRGMQAELPQYPRNSSEYRAAVHEIAAATTELIEAQGRLGQMWLAYQRRQAAQRREGDRTRTRRQLWLLTEAVTLVGALIVLLAAAGAVAVSKLAIGLPLLLAGGLMAASMRPRTARDAGPHALDVRKAVAATALAVIALLGALVWPVLGYACVLAIAVAAVPVLAAWQTRQRRAVEGDVRRD